MNFGNQNDPMKKKCVPKSILDTIPPFPEELFPNIHFLLKILLILPVSTALVERSFQLYKKNKALFKDPYRWDKVKWFSAREYSQRDTH